MHVRSILRVLALGSGLTAGLTQHAIAQEQGLTVTGRVTNEAGTALQGANVFITELNLSVGTNEQGRYTLTIPPARLQGNTVQLRARAIGYQPMARALVLQPGTQTVDFALRTDVNRLSEVVITGVTGATERAKVPFTIARVDSSEMPVVAVNPISQLQGKVPGANIVSNSGRPGAQPSVLLRGPSSINGAGRQTGPLYIVDGVILSGPLPDINPNDIASVEVLKGAAGSTLYGSSAANGVVQITTKNGQAAQDGTRFSVRTEVGLNDVEREFPLARNHALMLDETGTRFCVLDALGTNNLCSRTIDYRAEVARINNVPGDFAAAPPSFPVDPGSVIAGPALRTAFNANRWPGTTYNAVDQVVDPQPVIMTSAALSGRRGETNYFASIGYTDQGGAFRGLNGYQRASGRLNVGQRIGEMWDVQLTSYVSRSESDGSNQEEGGQGFFRLTRVPAIANLLARDTLGRRHIRTNLQSGGVQNENPLSTFEGIDRSDVRDRYLGGLTVRFTPLEWFDMEGQFSFDRSTLAFNQFRNRGFRTTNRNPGQNNGLIFNGANTAQSYNGALQSTFRRQLMPDLLSRLNFRVLYEQRDTDGRSLQGNTLRVTDVEAAPNATTDIIINSSETSQRQLSFSAGANFDFRDRYIVDFVVRRDGSSLFGSDQRWQTYPRVSASWLVGREPWWPAGVISQFTLRASYGEAGNVPAFVAQYETYSIGAGGTLTPLTLGNRDLRPEVAKELEVGTDLELFNRIGLSVTYAEANVENQILPVPISASTGFSSQWLNAGTMNNKTWEASLTAPLVQRENLTWSARLNYTSNVPTVTKLDVPPFYIGTNLQATNAIMRVEEGLRYGTFFGRAFVTGCSQLPAEFASRCGGPGADFQKNSDGYIVWTGGLGLNEGITRNAWNAFIEGADAPWGARTSWGHPIVLRDASGTAALINLGHATPDYQLGFSTNVQWGNFTFYGLVDASVGRRVWNQGRHWSYLDFLNRDVDQAGRGVESAKPMGYYWRAGPADGFAGTGGFYDILGPNNETVEDASFAKLRELTAAYRIGPVGGFGDWTVSLIGRNLKTWTDYKGFDPEVGVGNVPATTTAQSGSAAINAIDAFTFPNLRTFSLVINTSF